MAEELGVAVLRVTARTDEALKALQAFQAQAAKELSNIGQLNFSGLEQSAAQAGQRTGRALAQGVTQATQGIRFDNLREALDFSGALNGTLSDLRQYRAALVALREVTPATANGFGQLNDVIAGVTQAIRNYTSSTDQLQNAAAVEAIRAQTGALREQQTQLDATVGAERELVGQTQQVEQSQRAVATATRIATQALRDQVAALGSLAQKGVSDVAGTVRGVGRGVGAVGRGVGAVAKGAVSLGRAGYGIGAELGIFEDPKPGKVTAAIQQVIDRFKFLGEQAQTTRGKILRSIEAVGTAAGFVELARNADLIKASLSGVDIAAQTASKGLGLLDKVGGGFLNFLSNRFPDTAIGELARLGAGATDAAAGIGSATSSLTSFASQGLAASLDGLQAFIDALGAVPPEAQAAVLALAGLSIGFKEKPIVEGLTRVLEYLDGLSDKALKVRGDLNTVLGELSQFQDRLNNANQQKLLPAFTDRGLQPLDNAVNEGESLRRITDAIAGNWERGARFLEKSNDELRRLIDQGLLLRPLSGSPVVQTTNLLPPGAPASSLPNPRQYDRPIGPQPLIDFEAEERAARNLAQQEQDLAAVQQRRKAVQESLLQLEKAEQQAASRRAQAALKQLQDAAQTAAARNEAIRSLREAVAVSTGLASPIDGRLGQDRFVPGSPAFREQRRRRLGEAGSNALIGGAFPLLFGQGIGASIGGAAGGGLGGFAGGQLGFGLSLLGTAVGAQFDLATQKAGTLAAALKDPIGRFSELQQAGLLSSKGLERQVEALISTGRAAEAAALIQQDLANTYGTLGNAKALADQSDRLGRSWSQLTVTLANLVVSPVANLLQSTSDGLSGLASALLAVGQALPKIEGLIPKPVREAGKFASNQLLASAIPGGIGQLANLVSIGGKALGSLTGLFGGGGGNEPSPQVQAAVAAQKELTRLTQQQAVAEASGNRVLAVGTQLIAARVKLQQDLAALSEEDRKGPKGDQLRQQYQQTVAVTQAQAKAAADGAERELAATRQLLGLSGDALAFEQERLRIAEARRQSDKAAAELAKVKADPNADAAAIKAATDQARALSAEYEKQVQLALNSSTAQLATSERELANTRQLIGLEGERLSIRQEQQRVAQAESEFNSLDAQFRQQYGGISPNTLSGAELDAYKAAYNFREAAEARLEQTRITALDRIRQAEESLADQRLAVEQRIANARAGANLTGLGRGALSEVSAFQLQQVAAGRLAERAAQNPFNTDLAAQAQDARRALVAGGEELRQRMRDAFQTATDAVRNITRSIEDSLLALQRAQNTSGQGLNRFLSSQQVSDRQQAVNQQLAATAQQLADQLGRAGRPVNFTVTGTTEERNAAFADFIEAARAELRAPDELIRQQEQLITATNDLKVVNAALASTNTSVATVVPLLEDAVRQLVGKDWSVYVNVPGGSASGDVIGAVNGGF